ncbi:MAG: hypothetical protein WCW17_02530 [Patescibacteria group bacterium]|jgi:hypothetical protein
MIDKELVDILRASNFSDKEKSNWEILIPEMTDEEKSELLKILRQQNQENIILNLRQSNEIMQLFEEIESKEKK